MIHCCDDIFDVVGKIVSTEDTYKYHMQIQESEPEPAIRKRDAPLKASLKPARRHIGGHQRSSSDASSDHQEPSRNGGGGEPRLQNARPEDDTSTEGMANHTQLDASGDMTSACDVDSIQSVDIVPSYY